MTLPLYIIETVITHFLVNEILFSVIELKVKRKYAVLISLGLIGFTFILEAIISTLTSIPRQDLYAYSILTTLVPCLIVMLFIAKEPFTAHFVFFYTTLQCLASVTTSLSYLLQILFFPKHIIAEAIIHILLLSLELVLFKYVFHVKFKFYGKYGLIYLVLPVLCFVFWYLYSNCPTRLYDTENKVFIPYYNYNYREDIFWLMVLSMMMFYMLGLAIIIIDKVNKIKDFEREKAEITLQSEHIKHQIERQLERDEIIRVLNHDSRHHVNILKSMLTEKKTEEAYQYLSNLEMSMKKDYLKQHSTLFCENAIINAVLNNFVANALKENIKIKVVCDVPNVSQIPEFEIVALISNILENAINACVKIEEHNLRYIDFIFVKKNNQYILDETNPYVGKLIIKNNLPTSEKYEKGHGIGTQSIRHFSEKNNAIIKSTAKNNIFKINILFNISEK